MNKKTVDYFSVLQCTLLSLVVSQFTIRHFYSGLMDQFSQPIKSTICNIYNAFACFNYGEYNNITSSILLLNS